MHNKHIKFLASIEVITCIVALIILLIHPVVSISYQKNIRGLRGIINKNIVSIDKRIQKERATKSESKDVLCQNIFFVKAHDAADEWRCLAINSAVYKLDGDLTSLNKVSDPKSEGKEFEMLIKAGSNYIQDDFTIILPTNAEFVISESAKKYMRSTSMKIGIGKKSTLVIRARGNETSQEVSVDAETISRRVFGGYDDRQNLKDGYTACSGNKLLIEKATGSDLIVDGVLEVNLDISTNGVSGFALENEISKVAKSLLGVHASTYLEGVYDLVLMCLPPGTEVKTAYGYTGFGRSVYSDEWCLFPSAQMHEVGHNLGLDHSSENGLEYGDRTDIMGSSTSLHHEYPKMCFNGVKSWALGWYDDKSASIDLDVNGQDSWSADFVGVSDYLETSNDEQIVVAELITNNDSNEDDDIQNHYILYNRKEGINRQVMQYPNMITITKSHFESTADSIIEMNPSEMVAHLSVGESHVFPNHRNKGVDLIIKFCHIEENDESPSYATVSAYFSSGIDPCPYIETSAPISAPISAPVEPSGALKCFQRLFQKAVRYMLAI